MPFKIYYMTTEDRERIFGEHLGMRAWILNYQARDRLKLQSWRWCCVLQCRVL